MYDKLLKRLRNRRICIQQSGSLDDFPLLVEAADAIEELSRTHDADAKEIEWLKKCVQDLPRSPKWISVEERLPGYGEKCLVAFKLIGHNHWSIQVSYCYVQKEGFWSDCGRDYKAVAWRPLPEPPKEE